MAKLVLFLLVCYLHSSLQQYCEPMSNRPSNYPTVEISHSPDIVITGKPFNITCIARLSKSTIDEYDTLLDVTIYFGDIEVKTCRAASNGIHNVLACPVYISNATNKSGNYTCNTRSYYCTRITKTIIVKDLTSPRIISNPSSFTNLKNGQEINLTCVAYGIPPPVISWTKDDLPTTLLDIIVTYGGKTTSVLSIKVVNVTRFGVYRCQANNSEGTSFSNPVKITGPIPPVVKIIKEPADKSTIFGEHFNISCFAWTPIQYPTSIWSQKDMIPRKIHIIRNGKTLKTCENKIINEAITQGESCVVTLRNTIMRDAGEYVCIANNTVASVSVAINVTVKPLQAPRFVLHPGSKIIEYGDQNVTLECSATGVPQPIIRWLKDGSPIRNRENVYGNQSYSILVIPRIETNHRTRYRCYAENRVGDLYSNPATLTVSSVANDVVPTISTTRSPPLYNGTLIGKSELYPLIATGAVLFLIFLAFGALFVGRRYRQQRKFRRRRFYTFTAAFENATFNPTNYDTAAKLRSVKRSDTNPMDTNDAVLDDEMYLRLLGVGRNWEIEPGRLVVTDVKLGGGEFGIVKKGIYTRKDGKDMTVAVKQLKDTAEDTERNALLVELDMLRRVGHHPHIVSLVGACTTQEPLSVVIEFVAGGSLDKVLKKSRIDPIPGDSQYVNISSRLTERELLQIAVGVAKGMSHLEKKECVHRDLAARNVLVAKGLVAKVTDFGLARDISCHGKYIKTSEGKVAWKWQSVESLQGVFSTKSDVWSFGILLWEIITLGQEPYKGETNFISLFNKLQCGYHMGKPRHCSDELYYLMKQCWKRKPEERPSFTEVRDQLKDFLKDHKTQYINVLSADEDNNDI